MRPPRIIVRGLYLDSCLLLVISLTRFNLDRLCINTAESMCSKDYKPLFDHDLFDDSIPEPSIRRASVLRYLSWATHLAVVVSLIALYSGGYRLTKPVSKSEQVPDDVSYRRLYCKYDCLSC
ncbi:hypothetical protein AUEXF2481DRAFT_42237 [Aureobasidium subglaciale EXF-2481]|uniref:Uncharacterized protein n=1 Tax=Aureobasidium subglaciale (strain EXF-2481) TaxID=1043005 RepID=A0A074Y5N6_AURSE|nr:uncharacterized protein AUEXF2481DRAFT_42237 [Aureobasidium subglaciale EXF-2481]KEQ93035.1 hypothetical protein AUEXF2481DRAFT_42237 [Aureobasidium subglaciale EXF-2481]